MEHPEHIKTWAKMQEARDKGDLETYYRLRDEQMAMLTRGKSARTDAEPKDSGIDWERVAREAQTMVDLNRESTRRWQESHGQESKTEE